MKHAMVLVVVVFGVFLSGCTDLNSSPGRAPTLPLPPAPPPIVQPDGSVSGSDEENYAVVRVFYATDRKQTTNIHPSSIFGSDRGVLTYGICDVSIPRDHRMGHLEGPSIWRLEWSENPEKHVVVLEVIPTERNQYFKELGTIINASSEKTAFVFVHGYNVTFTDAARRTAQISYDIGFDGAPIFYSWPSQGSFQGYPIDETNIEWTQSHLKSFLVDVVKQTQADSIYLIAHSMGNRALTKAFSEISRDQPALASVFREIILTAPDIDAEVFKNDIAPQLVGNQRRVTLYASTNDTALSASKTFHGYARAGDIGNTPVILTGLDTIDASNVSTDFLGHSYFAEHTSVLSDIFYLIRGIQVSKRHGIRPKQIPQGKYWVFQAQ